MRRLLRFAARLYPHRWRQRYGAEFEALLDDLNPGWRDILDVVRGGMMVRFKESARAGSVFTFAFIGAAAMICVAFWLPAQYTSTGLIQPRAERQRIPEIVQGVMSRKELASLIQRLDLYAAERRNTPLEKVIDNMRRKIEFRPDNGNVTVTFTYSEPKAAQMVTQDFISKFIEKYRAGMTVQEIRDSPTGMLKPAALPKPVPPKPFLAAGIGLSGGGLLGLAFVQIRRRITKVQTSD